MTDSSAEWQVTDSSAEWHGMDRVSVDKSGDSDAHRMEGRGRLGLLP